MSWTDLLKQAVDNLSGQVKEQKPVALAIQESLDAATPTSPVIELDEPAQSPVQEPYPGLYQVPVILRKGIEAGAREVNPIPPGPPKASTQAAAAGESEGRAISDVDAEEDRIRQEYEENKYGAAPGLGRASEQAVQALQQKGEEWRQKSGLPAHKEYVQAVKALGKRIPGYNTWVMDRKNAEAAKRLEEAKKAAGK